MIMPTSVVNLRFQQEHSVDLLPKMDLDFAYITFASSAMSNKKGVNMVTAFPTVLNTHC